MTTMTEETMYAVMRNFDGEPPVRLALFSFKAAAWHWLLDRFGQDPRWDVIEVTVFIREAP